MIWHTWTLGTVDILYFSLWYSFPCDNTKQVTILTNSWKKRLVKVFSREQWSVRSYYRATGRNARQRSLRRHHEARRRSCWLGFNAGRGEAWVREQCARLPGSKSSAYAGEFGRKPPSPCALESSAHRTRWLHNDACAISAPTHQTIIKILCGKLLMYILRCTGSPNNSLSYVWVYSVARPGYLKNPSRVLLRLRHPHIIHVFIFPIYQ